MQNFYILKTNTCNKILNITFNQQKEVRVLKDQNQDTLNSFALLNNGKCTSGDCSVGLYVYEMD